MLKRYSLLVLLCAVLTLTACGFLSKKDPSMVDNGSSEDTYVLPDVIKIGFIAPLTGNAAVYGQDMKTGVARYFSENPDLGGKPLEVIYEDSKCNEEDAASAAKKLINADKVQAIIMADVCGSDDLVVAPIAEKNKVALLSSGPSTTEQDLVGKGYSLASLLAQAIGFVGYDGVAITGHLNQ